MMDRREFVRSLAAIGGIAAASAGTAAAAIPGAKAKAVVLPVPDVPWRRRIFCHFDRQKHENLYRELQGCALETGCDIFFGENGSPDLYAIGGFVLILDRSLVGDDVWQEYVDMYRDDGDVTPCFIIDDRRDLPLPNWNYAYRFDMSCHGGVATIVDAIRQMKIEMNRRLPDLFKRSAG